MTAASSWKLQGNKLVVSFVFILTAAQVRPASRICNRERPKDLRSFRQGDGHPYNDRTSASALHKRVYISCFEGIPMQRRLVPSLVVVALLLSATGASAADWPVPRGPSRELVKYEYDPAQWKKVPPEFLDDAPACILYSGVT